MCPRSVSSCSAAEDLYALWLSESSVKYAKRGYFNAYLMSFRTPDSKVARSKAAFTFVFDGLSLAQSSISSRGNNHLNSLAVPFIVIQNFSVPLYGTTH